MHACKRQRIAIIVGRMTGRSIIDLGQVELWLAFLTYLLICRWFLLYCVRTASITSDVYIVAPRDAEEAVRGNAKTRPLLWLSSTSSEKVTVFIRHSLIYELLITGLE